MEELLRRELGCSSVQATGHSGGGCISQGQSYDTDRGRVFVKTNTQAEVNDWQKDWVAFYAQQRIQPQMDMVEKGSGDREALELWSALQLKIPDLFLDLDIVPALLHGDLWGGNVAEDSSGPIIFDPASFYGHSEYELAIAGMFGGFSSTFYSAYHNKIPKAPGFEKRLKLYQLFHYLNHWNHFGSGYRGSSLNIMRNLIK
uniref:protein-ribulosamine 3-kinase n=1 Tax=Molossus molossus TaxID=27622 RepID=A0A7J8CXT7_MOLMO|nr:fructosamine 3 kinase related protein [Molossus molossus]